MSLQALTLSYFCVLLVFLGCFPAFSCLSLFYSLAFPRTLMRDGDSPTVNCVWCMWWRRLRRPGSTAEYETSGGGGKQKKQAEAFNLESETTFFWNLCFYTGTLHLSSSRSRFTSAGCSRCLWSLIVKKGLNDLFLWRLFCWVFNFWSGGYKLFSKLNMIYFFPNFPFLSAFCAVH